MLVDTSEGIFKVKSLRRTPDRERWVAEQVEGIIGVPRKPYNCTDNDRLLEWKWFRLWWKKTQVCVVVIEGEVAGDLRFVPAPQADGEDEDSTDDEGPPSTSGSEDNMPSLESGEEEAWEDDSSALESGGNSSEDEMPALESGEEESSEDGVSISEAEDLYEDDIPALEAEDRGATSYRAGAHTQAGPEGPRPDRD